MNSIVIDDKDLKEFIDSYQKYGSYSIPFSYDFGTINMNQLKELKNKYKKKELSVGKYLYILSSIEDFLIKNENINSSEEILDWLSNEIILIEHILISKK